MWWYENPRARRRPFLILTRDEVVPLLNQVLAVPATRAIRGIPTEVPLDRGDGMPEECALSLDNVTLVRPDLCTRSLLQQRTGRAATYRCIWGGAAVSSLDQLN